MEKEVEEEKEVKEEEKEEEEKRGTQEEKTQRKCFTRDKKTPHRRQIRNDLETHLEVASYYSSY